VQITNLHCLSQADSGLSGPVYMLSMLVPCLYCLAAAVAAGGSPLLL